MRMISQKMRHLALALALVAAFSGYVSAVPTGSGGGGWGDGDSVPGGAPGPSLLETAEDVLIPNTFLVIKDHPKLAKLGRTDEQNIPAYLGMSKGEYESSIFELENAMKWDTVDLSAELLSLSPILGPIIGIFTPNVAGVSDEEEKELIQLSSSKISTYPFSSRTVGWGSSINYGSSSVSGGSSSSLPCI